MVNYPCPKCDLNCTKSQHSIQCNCCEQWLHKDCVEGMSEEFYDNVVKARELFGTSSFLCKTCRKVVLKVQKGQKEMEAKVKNMEKEIVDLKAEMKEMHKRMDQYEGGMKNVESGLEKAKQEVKEEVKTELREKEERSENMVIYGLKESDKTDSKERIREDEEAVKKIWNMVEVKIEEGETEVRFRAGKKREDGKPRPLIVKFKEEETKEKVLSGARKLARKDEWKNVFLAQDLTAKQREEDRKKEEERKREAEEKTAKAREEGKEGKWIVVGKRGRRKVVWKEEEEER